MHVIQKEISSLSKKYRKVAKLFFNEELSYDEISERLHLPLNTVKVRLNRARKQLVTKLETVRV